MKVNKLNENFYNEKIDTVELEYPNLEFTLYGKQTDVDAWEEEDIETSWTYEVPKDDLYFFILEKCIKEEDFPDAFKDSFDPTTEDDWNVFVNWLDNNFETIYSKYETKILDKWEHEAVKDAQENYNPDDYVDWDSMSGGHDDYDLDDDF